ncbi:MAG: cache domain-containing protein [Mangrovibacterium sp.]
MGEKTLGGKKVAFVKKFKPFNWYFGSKCYIVDYYEEFKKDIADKISSERFRYGGYIFLTELSGISCGIKMERSIEGIFKLLLWGRYR